MKILSGLLLLFVVGQMPGGGMIGTDLINVRYGPGEQELGRAVLTSAMKASKTVEDRLGVVTTKEVVILLAPGGKGGFEGAQPGETPVPAWAVGTAYPRFGTIVLRKPDNYKFRLEDLDAVTTHEFAHVAVHAYLNNIDIPRWLDEGLASFAAGERNLTASTTIGIAAISGNIIPLESLHDWWPPSSNQADLAYAEAMNFVSWIESSRGEGTIKAVVKSFKETGDLDAALFAVTGKPLAALEDEWLNRVRKRYIWIPILGGGASLWGMATILFLWGYWRKRKMGKLKIAMWEMEDEMKTLKLVPPPPEPPEKPKHDNDHNHKKPPTVH